MNTEIDINKNIYLSYRFCNQILQLNMHFIPIC